MSASNVILNLVEYLKNPTTPPIYRSYLLEILTSFSNAITCYIYGSKINNKIRLAYSVGSKTIVRRLGNSVFIFTAQLQATNQCLKFIHCLPPPFDRFFLILSESLSTLTAISDINSTTSGVTRILNLLSNLYAKSCTVVFVWIPSHRSIQGADEVDSAIEAATSHLRFSPQSLFTKQNISHLIRHLIHQNWDLAKLSPFRRHKPAQVEKWSRFWCSSHRPSRKHEICLTRL